MTATGATALLAASRSGKVPAIQALLDRGASMLFEPRPGVNALTAACEEGDVASVSTLLGRGAPVTAMTAEGMPPLALAAGMRHRDRCCMTMMMIMCLFGQLGL